MGSAFSFSHGVIDDTANSLIFHPAHSSQEEFHRAYDNITFVKSSNENKICLVHILPKKPSPKYLVWCHGNSGDLTHIDDYLKFLCKELNVNVIAFDYQGYGISEGSPSEDGCYDDLGNVINYLKSQKISNNNIYLCGHSMGTGVVVDYASKHNWSTPIMLISPYKTMAKVMVDSICVDATSSSTNFCSGKHVDKFRSEAKISKVLCPVKIVHGNNDELINISHGKTLYDSLPNKKFDPRWIDNAGHNNILNKIPFDDFREVLCE